MNAVAVLGMVAGVLLGTSGIVWHHARRLRDDWRDSTPELVAAGVLFAAGWSLLLTLVGVVGL